MQCMWCNREIPNLIKGVGYFIISIVGVVKEGSPTNIKWLFCLKCGRKFEDLCEIDSSLVKLRDPDIALEDEFEGLEPLF